MLMKMKLQIVLLAALLLIGFGGTDVLAFQLGAREASEWIKTLDRPTRVAEMKIEEVIPLLQLQPGDIVVDIGSGSGQFSIPLARAVAPGGKLIAEDIHPGLLTHVELRAKEFKVTNLQTVRGEVDDPKLPELVDLAFFHDVLHHIEHRAVFLQSLAKYIKPDGRVAIIDIDKDHPRASHKDDPVYTMSQNDITGWMRDAGFSLVEEHNDLFDRKIFLIFAR